ncbi:phosphotransferase [Luteococcus peritonei]|uniref:Phosphotransferase n=1 Tax=Luteococcus peritonei TaxID=88874 RepID=A0ABW4S0G5_9ACTN
MDDVEQHSEEVLAGGNATDQVVRIGQTVRKPWLETSGRAMALLEHVRSAGIDVPRFHGRDEQGRMVLDHVPGTMAIDLAPLDEHTVHRVGALVRSIHDACADLPVPQDWPVLLPAPHPDLLCHNDLATWNLVVDGDRLVFIDWDGAGPSNRLWDLAYAAIAFAHLFADADPAASARRLAALLDGYDADEAMRAALPEAMAARAEAMWHHLREAHRTGWEPWASMYVEGHGETWQQSAAFIRRHQELWRRAALGS